jgi:hypothetical protein
VVVNDTIPGRSDAVGDHFRHDGEVCIAAGGGIRNGWGALFVGMTGLTRHVVRSRAVQVYGVASCLMRSHFGGAA